jgi:hypothetical protein
MAPTDNDSMGFAHRPNDDGSFDSICLHCYRTIATANSVEGLMEAERLHKCDNDIHFRGKIRLVKR